MCHILLTSFASEFLSKRLPEPGPGRLVLASGSISEVSAKPVLIGVNPVGPSIPVNIRHMPGEVPATQSQDTLPIYAKGFGSGKAENQKIGA